VARGDRARDPLEPLRRPPAPLVRVTRGRRLPRARTGAARCGRGRAARGSPCRSDARASRVSPCIPAECTGGRLRRPAASVRRAGPGRSRTA
jgi:hypothetical protein